MIHTRCLAVLETMWGTEGAAPGLFRINPNNFTGRRLYWLLGHDDLWVTNVCPQQVANARQHGKPDVEWLRRNLKRIEFDLLLICGKVAQNTFYKLDIAEYPECRIMFIDHPAARAVWNRQALDNTRTIIQSGVH